MVFLLNFYVAVTTAILVAEERPEPCSPTPLDGMSRVAPLWTCDKSQGAPLEAGRVV